MTLYKVDPDGMLFSDKTPAGKASAPS